MNNLFNTLLGQIGDKGIQNFSKILGKDGNETKDILGTAAGLLFGQLERNADNSDKKESLLNAIKNDHNGDRLAQLGDILDGKSDDEGKKILGHIFGEKTEKVKKLLAKNNEIDEKSSDNLLTKLAPLVMETLGKEESDGKLDLDNIVDVLKGSGKSANDNSSLAMNIMTKFLDEDGDGEIIDDLLSKGANFLKGILK